MNYFKYQSQIPYTFVSDTGNTTLTITNITQRAILTQRVRAVVDAYYDYFIPDGDRPDTVASRMYDHSKYTWVVLLINNINSLFDWPLTSDEFARYLAFKYGSTARASNSTPTESAYYFTKNKTVVSAYEYSQLPVLERGDVLPSQYCFTATGAPIDFESYYHLPEELRGNIQTPYEYEFELNENKRKIKIVNKQLLSALDREYRTVFAG